MSSKKETRKNFKKSVLERDLVCQHCGLPYIDTEDNMDAHHITDRAEMPNGGYVPENGITLCKSGLFGNESCHMKAEKFHISGGTEWEEGMHPDDLYKLIGSSKELAIEKSKNLK